MMMRRRWAFSVFTKCVRLVEELDWMNVLGTGIKRRAAPTNWQQWSALASPEWSICSVHPRIRDTFRMSRMLIWLDVVLVAILCTGHCIPIHFEGKYHKTKRKH